MAEGVRGIDVYLLYSWILVTYYLSSILWGVHTHLNYSENRTRPIHHPFPQVNLATTLRHCCSTDGLQYHLCPAGLLILYISNDLWSPMQNPSFMPLDVQ